MPVINKGADLKSILKKSDWSANNIKLFANFVEFGGPEESLFSEDAYTLAYIKNSQLIESVVLDRQINTDIMMRVNRIDKSQMKLRNTTSLSVVADINVMEFFKKETVLFTIGEPLNIEKYNIAEQAVYASNPTIPTEVNQFIDSPELDDKLVEAIQNLNKSKNLTIYNLTNIELINNITNSNIKFTRTERITNPSLLRVSYERGWAMHRIFAKGFIDGNYTDINVKYKPNPNLLDPSKINFKTDSNPLLALVKMFPVATETKVVNMSNTMDFNFSPPYNILKTFKGIDQGLRQYIISGTDNLQWKKELWRVFLSILELTKAYSNNFTEYQIKGTDGRSGIDPDAVIGGDKIGLLGGVNATDAVSAISGRIEDWKNKYPTYTDTGEFKVFRAFLFLLSEYVQCDEALGGGLTRAHEIFNIFYFDLRTAITKGLAGNYTVDSQGNISEQGDATNNDIIVQLKSRYYDINETTGYLTIKEQFEKISEYQILDIDGQANIAEMPENLTPLNYISKAGDIQPVSEDISKFMVYMPVDNQDQLQNVYGVGDISSETDPGGPTEKEVDKSGTSSALTQNTNECGGGSLASKPPPPPVVCDPTVSEPSKPEITPDAIYGSYIRPILSSNQKIKRIDGVPDIRNIKITKTSDKIDRECVSYNGNSYSGYYCTKTLETRTAIWGITYDYTIIETTTKPPTDIDQLVLIGDLPSFDKRLYLNKVKKHYSYVNVLLDLDFNYINENENVEGINQLVLSGLWGNDFSIYIYGRVPEGSPVGTTAPIIIVNGLEFLSKYDETKTKTKINL